MDPRPLHSVRPSRLLGTATALAVWLAAAPAAPAASDPAAGTGAITARLQDTYAIYSMLLPGQVFAAMDSSQRQRLAIAATTVNDLDGNPTLAPDALLSPPADHPNRFLESLADYYRRRRQRMLLTRHFQLTTPYVLLMPAEVEEFRASRSSPDAGSGLQEKYADLPGITYFSEVYFDSTETAALVYMLDWCGNLCAQANWFYLEKENGQWILRSGPAD